LANVRRCLTLTIVKLPRQRKYALTEKGRNISTAVNVALAYSVEDLLSFAA
jgi:hypothetical protein